MANELMIPGGDNKVALPAHIQARFATAASEIVTADRLPTLSIKGKVFTITADGETWPLMKTDPDTNTENPVANLPLVILDYGVKKGRSYYDSGFDPNEVKAPKCYSNDSIAPEDDVEEKQSDKCATCPFSVKGSKVNDNGTSTVACQQHRILAVVPHKRLDLPPLRLRIAPTSDYDGRSPDLKAKQLFAFSNYLDFLRARGLPSTRVVVTSASFDPAVAYPKLIFKAVKYVSPEELDQIDAIMASGAVDTILGENSTSHLAALKSGTALPKAAPAAAALPAPKAQHPADAALAKAGAANPALTPKAGTDAAKAAPAVAAKAGTFVAPEQEEGEDEDDYAERSLAAKRAWKAAEAEKAAAAEALAKLGSNVNALAKAATFTPPAIEDGEDEDDYEERKLAAKRAWKAEQAKLAEVKPAAPVAFVPPAIEEGEDEDDHQERVLKAKRAWKAAQGGAAPAPAKAMTATAGVIADVKAATAEPPKRTRRTKEQIAADNAAKAAAAAGAVAEEVPADQAKPVEKFLPGAISGSDLGGDDDEGGLDAAPAAPVAAKPTGGAKAGAAPAPKKGVEAPAAAVPGDVASLLDAWPDE